MKEISLYQCEICKTQFKDAQKATICEASHLRLVKDPIIYMKYRSNQSYPDAIEIEFDDGKTVAYRR